MSIKKSLNNLYLLTLVGLILAFALKPLVKIIFVDLSIGYDTAMEVYLFYYLAYLFMQLLLDAVLIENHHRLIKVFLSQFLILFLLTNLYSFFSFVILFPVIVVLYWLPLLTVSIVGFLLGLGIRTLHKKLVPSKRAPPSA